MGNVDNVKQYSASNPPPYPVTSVNGEVGEITLNASDVGARPDTWTPTKSDVGLDNVVNERQYSSNNPPPYPVTSVAGKTGAVTVSKSDVGLGNVGNFKAVSTVASQGLTDTEKSNARANIGAGTYSKSSTGIPATDLASSVQTSLGKADTAVQPSSLATVATSGSYNDLTNKPTIPAAQVQTDWSATSGIASIKNKPTLATVATSGSYNDLTNKPTPYSLPIATTSILGGIKSGGSLDVKSDGTTQVKFYDKAISANVDKLAMGCIDEFGHNKLAFLGAQYINVEYSNDSGATWADYEATDAQKIAAVTTSGSGFIVGKKTSGVTINDQVRMTLQAAQSGNNRIYTASDHLLINISTVGADGCKAKIETLTIGNVINNIDSWATLGTYDISGWSGWNSLPCQLTFGGNSGQTSQIGKLRITLTLSSLSTTYANTLQLIDVRLIGHSNWAMPSELARVGHLYTMDTSQNATFPAKVTATGGFSGNLTGNASTATTATKLGSTTVGGTTTPIYLNNGTPTALSYTIAKSVPSDAKFTDTTYSDATTSTHGLMTAADKTKLNGIATGAEVNVQSDWNVTDSTSDAFIKNKPTIPSAVTESTVSGWGFTKNTGTVTGIKMNGASKGTSGVVDLGTVLTSHQDISGKENTSNKVTSWSSTTTDTHYPSEKLVKSALDGKAASSHSHTKSQITDFPTLATVATSGSYNDLTNKPTIPTVNNATLTIQKNGTSVGTFTANASTNTTANITVPTKVSELTNDSGYTTNIGTITGITMNGASKGTSGVVDLGTVLTSHQDISGKADRIQGIYYGTCSTAQGTKAKVVTLTNGTGFSLSAGACVIVKFTNASAAATMTLNVNNTGAKNLYRYGTTTMSSGTTTTGWAAGASVFFVYDGSAWYRVFWENTTYSSMTVEEGTTGTATTARTVTAANLKQIIEAHSSRVLKFQDTIVPVSAWESDSTYEDYPYRASIALTGVTAAMCPQVYFSMELINEPDVVYSPLSETYAGGVYIYADSIPQSAITIPSIVCI